MRILTNLSKLFRSAKFCAPITPAADFEPVFLGDRKKEDAAKAAPSYVQVL